MRDLKIELKVHYSSESGVKGIAKPKFINYFVAFRS